MKILAENRKARFDYQIKDTFEAGVVLKGYEVKAIRSKNMSLKGSFVVINQGEIQLLNAHIPLYEKATIKGYESRRTRKLLLHKKEIQNLSGKLEEKGITLIPLKIYLKKGKIKVEVGIGKGKSKIDKRETIKRREDERKMRRAIRRKR
jgi:SsrA-binding protein